jgi:hypothetical protein
LGEVVRGAGGALREQINACSDWYNNSQKELSSSNFRIRRCDRQ